MNSSTHVTVGADDRWVSVADKLPRTPARTVHRSWLLAFDAIGFLLGWLVVLLQGDVGDVGHRASALLLLTTSVSMWSLFDRRRSLDDVLRRSRPWVYFLPTVAAIVSAVVLAAARLPVPVLGLVGFAIVWTGVRFVARSAVKRRLPPLRLLVIGEPGFATELRDVDGVEVFSHEAPPARLEGYDVVVTDPLIDYDRAWKTWMDHADFCGVKVLPAPLAMEALTGRVPFEMLNGTWAFQVLEGQSRYLPWKRILDVAAVLLFAPLILLVAGIVAILILLDSGGPVLFWQERVGYRGKPFMMAKFRSMRTDAEAAGHAFASHADPRITPLGHWLRKFRLDEIPQLWNVLRGEMSIIGPRPEQWSFAQKFEEEIPLYELRHNLRPGITGWAQVMQGYADDTLATKTKLRHDFYYVRRCSFMLDMRIVLKTLRTIATGFGSR